MRQDLRISLLFTFFAGALSLSAQQNNTGCPGVPGACGYTNTTQSVQRSGPQSPQNGNGTLGVIFDMQKCGLDYTSASQRLGKRFTPQGINQPAPFGIAGIPACAVIEKAYLWCEGSGNGAAQTATIAGPFGTQSFPMAVCGQGPDKCWGYSGSYTYRADVTAVIGGNGTYNISGILTNPPTAGNDMDGATLLVVWSLPTATWAGRIVIADGAIVINGGVTTYNMPISPAVCGATTNARAFMGVGDIQFNPNSWSANGTPCPLTWNWWNFNDVATTVANGQATSAFNVNSSGDCYNLCISGLYFRTTTCTTCPLAQAMTATSTVTAASCSNCNGTATITNVTGGTGPFTYSWNTVPVQTTATATGLCQGTYVCTITSANGCQTTTQTVTITNAGGGLTIASTPPTNVTCFGYNNGSAVATSSGGTGPFTFTWNPVVTATTSGNTSTATGLGPGSYVATVTDANGCTGQQTFTITEPPQLTAVTTGTNTTCGQTNGSVSVAVSGGTGAPNIMWTPGNYTTATVNNLAAGSYNVLITDANGCTTTAAATIAPSTNMSVTQTQTDLTCWQDGTGAASVTVSGNNGPVTYTWTPAGPNSPSQTGLQAGTYIVDAVDPQGCSTSSTFTITEPPQLTTTVGGFNVSCFGACDGQIVVIPTGGTGTYTFAWSNTCNQPSCNGICAGNYNVTVTDQNGCTSAGSATVTEPPAIVVTTSYDTAHCGQSDGNAYVNASGGTGTLSFNWTPGNVADSTLANVQGGTYQCVISDGNGCADTVSVNVINQPGVVATMGPITSVACFGGNTGDASATFAGGNGPYTISWNTTPPQSTATATGLTAGSYIVTATDADGCTSTANAVVTEPPLLTITATTSPAAVCLGQPITLTATPAGGTPIYTVGWTPGNLIGATQNLIPQASGCYTALVTDANGCIDTVSTCVTVNPIPVAAFVGDSLSGCAPLCVNFSDQTTVGSGTIQGWAWDFGDVTTGNTQNPSHCYSTAGVYTVSLTVTSNAGCTNTIVMNNYIDVFGIPTAAFTAGPQPTTELNPLIYFTDMSIGAVTWDWSFGDMIPASTSQLQNPTFNYPTSGCFDVQLDVASVNGCTDSTMEQICIDPDVAIYVPNTFTPNDDGINDLFFAQGLGIDPEHFELWVFDRWGNLIFYTDDLYEGWNGKVQGNPDLCQEDTYVWKIKCRDMLDKKHNLIGHVNLIR